ncbi:MAG: DUF6702 family protein [Aquaticitalea sp.]
MFKKIIFSIALLVTLSANAHQPDISTTMLVEQENKTWVLQISASLTAFQQEIRTHFADTPYKTPEEFQQMVLQHIKNNLTLTFNDGQDIRLSEGRIILGHETKVVFKVFGMPSDIKSVFVKNSAFSDIYKSQSALVLLKGGFSKEHFVLNDDNNHTLKLVANNHQFVIEAKSEASFFTYKTFLILLGIFALTFLMKIIITKITRNEKQ